MKHYEIAIALLSVMAMVLLVMIACALNKPAEPEPPEVNAAGLCCPVKVQTVQEQEYEMYFTEADVIALAQMLYGEARGCTVDNQMKCVWCVLNRVDDSRFPDSIIGVLSQPHQFHGYSAGFPVWDNLVEIARDVMTRWSAEKQGAEVERELDESAVFFTGDGVQNWFRSVY